MGDRADDPRLRRYPVRFAEPLVTPAFMSFPEWCEKRCVTAAEYRRLEEAGELDPMGVYVVTKN